MIFGSVCSGIEAASVAWHPLGWRAAFLSEIEPFPRAVLAHHYPEVPLHGDFTTIKAGEYQPIDLLVGGTPCQSFSVAGLRGGLDDDRGNLALEYLRLADRLRPRWLVWENVPGVLSSNGGRDFGAILGGMVELGYGFAYRVLDAQFFGVAQRRRRVFVVGYAGDWRRAAAVLFERHSLQGHPPPRREAGPVVAALTADGVGTCGADDNQGQAGHLIPFASIGNGEYGPGVGSLRAKGADCGGGSETLIAHTLKGEGFDASEDGTGRGTPIVPVCFSAKDHGADAMSDLSPTLRAGGHAGSHANAGVMPAVAFGITRDALDRSGEGTGGTPGERSGLGVIEEQAQCLKAKGPGAVAFNWQGGGEQTNLGYDPSSPVTGSLSVGQTPAVHTSAVRRLTPRECERLQGFPDDYTLIPWRKGMAPDGPRYKALGNSMAVPVMRWIGERIEAVEAIAAQRIAA